MPPSINPLLPAPGMAVTVHHCHDDNCLCFDSIDDLVRKPARQCHARLAMNHGKSLRIASNQGQTGINRPDKFRAESLGALLIPHSRLGDIFRRLATDLQPEGYAHNSAKILERTFSQSKLSCGLASKSSRRSSSSTRCSEDNPKACWLSSAIESQRSSTACSLSTTGSCCNVLTAAFTSQKVMRSRWLVKSQKWVAAGCFPDHVMTTPPGSTPNFSTESHPHGRYQDARRAARTGAWPEQEGHHFRASRDFRTFAKLHLTAFS